ncbi:MAG: hypothetical protein CMH15_13100 [Mesonia sp.]|uniref:Uncharacterized protein n=2 Tax=Flavobacteriaceae TaxID=49546 RepID=A0AC61Y678_9FLAO|nr:hypothetical protein [Mesonia sp.]MBJ99362.1 hypothetical protein [Flavobacteriaceae bacterium]VVU99637.1 hypothetical protein FVB9532_00893 [Mesonia oceanica]
MGSDSLVININYRVLEGCLGHFRGRIKIKTYDDKFHFFHEYFGDNYTVEVFEGRKENIIKKVEQLEVNSKKSIKSCGGTSGGTAYHFNMCINNSEETEFGYCKSEYDGLAYFLSKMRNLKTKEIFIKN